MSKTNAQQPSAPQSVPVSNDAPSSSSPAKPTFNYAAAAARSSSNTSRPAPPTTPITPAAPAPAPAPAPVCPPSFASAVVATSSPLASNSPSTKPSSKALPEAIPTSRVPNGASSALKSPVPTPERKSSLISAKSHNIKPSSSHISFGSLADIPAKAADTSVLSSSPANPPTLSQRDGPPVFGSVSADPAKKPAKSSSLVTSTTSKPSGAPPPPSGTSVKPEKKKFDFQSFFMSGGESVSNPPPPPPPAASSGTSPSPSISYRGDPTQHRRNPNTLDSHSGAPAAPVSPRPAHVGLTNGPSAGGSFHSPLSGASRAFTPAQGPPPMSQQSQHHHQYGMGPGGAHWQNGPAPNSPHFVPGNPPLNPNLPNYPLPNGAIGSNHGNNQSQYLPKPPPFPHRNGLGGQSAGSSTTIYPPSSGRSNLHHQPRNGANGPPSPRLPPSNAPNGGQSPNYQHSTNNPGMPAPYWPQGAYPPNGPGPYPPYGYNPNNMPTYPHPNNFPPSQHGQHSSPQLSNQTGPSSVPPPSAPPPPTTTSAALPSSSRTHPTPPPPLPVPSSPVPASQTYAPPYPPALYSPGSSHSRGPSLSYNAPTFNPSAAADFKPHTPNVAAPAFMPRRSAAVQIKKPVTPISETSEKLDDGPPSAQTSKGRRISTSGEGGNQAKSSDTTQSKVKIQEPPKKLVPASTKVIEKSESSVEAQKAVDAKKAAEEASEKKKLEESKAAEEAAAKAKAEKAKAEEDARLAKEQADKEAKELAEKEAKAQAEQEAKAKLEEEAKTKALKELNEKKEREQLAKKEQEAKELAEKQAKEIKASSEAKLAESQAKATSTTPSAPTPASQPVDSKSSTDPPASVRPEPAAAASALPSKPVNGATLPASSAKVRPAPIDVNAPPQSKIPGESVTPSLPSALSSARKIEDLGKVSYPENIQSPRSELNADATPGKFRYDRAFLLQFMEVCKGKPVQLPDLDSIGMVDAHNAGMNPMSRTQSTTGQRRNGGQVPAGSRGPSGALTPSGSSMSMMGPAGLGSRAGAGAGMPMFNTGATRSSEERFNQSNRPSMGAMPIGMGIMLPGRPSGQMSRTPSSNALPGIMSNGARDTSRRSGRGSRRDGAPGQSNVNPNLNRGMSMQQMFQVEAVQPLQPSANSWAAARSTVLDEDSPELVNRKVKALLNKLTLDKFESISDQVIAWANKSEKEHDGRILRQVIALIFEKATDEAHWSEMYAKLCRKLMEKLSAAVKDESISDGQGNKVHGGQLFRKYLLNRCQEDYERGWSKRDELAAAAAGKAADDAVKQAANEKSRAEAEAEGKEAPSKEAEILSDEYYAAQKAKRQGLGLVRFIGELFKLNMLTERIMHECIKKLLSNIDTPEEEDIESLSRLMMTVGGLLDHEKAISHMNVYFSRMLTMSHSPNLSSRARFMIQDVIDTRSNKWVGRNVAAGPKLISQIHEEAAQAAAEQSRQAQQASKKMNDLSRGGSRGGRNRDQPGGDGWSAVGGASAPPPRPSKAGDLTQFGKLRETSSTTRSTYGPSAVFANKGKQKDAKLPGDREPAVAVAPNPFAALGGDTNEASGNGLSRKPSTAELAPAGRPRLNLAPRTLPLPKEGAEKKEGTGDEVAGSTEEPDISDEEAKRAVKSRVDEFFHVRSLDEATNSFSSLVKSRHHELIRALIEKAFEKKKAEIDLTASLFKIVSKDIVTQPVFLKAFLPIIEQLDDTAVDVRYAYEFCGQLLKASGLSEADVKQLAQKIEAEELETVSQRLIDCFNSAKLN
ncbi:hypothetical protein PSTG_13483 [Puccinia striiformis f. sp. tritici PST-78]|uniref:MI domain-containing protein n=1 Tax=Puccinia striiformis f. sp. tritici PST-78 TaxID=1165861 RepID=A0A0L0V297_9BASI|nr:hypothetical protein PSTG_13483 [Puccinia striiformis f. sp. tritici PST-78]